MITTQTTLLVATLLLVLASGKKNNVFKSHIKKFKPTNVLEYAGKTYYFGNIFRANFYAALQFCRQLDMQLVSIMNEDENVRLAKFANEIGMQYEHFWTSGTNLANSERFFWLSTGSAMVYTSWYAGQPSGVSSDGTNHTENCVEAKRLEGPKGLYWNDRYCFEQLSFICERYGNECY